MGSGMSRKLLSCFNSQGADDEAERVTKLFEKHLTAEYMKGSQEALDKAFKSDLYK